MQLKVVVFSALLVLISARPDKEWGISSNEDNSPFSGISDFFNGIGDWISSFVGPSFLKGVNKQGRQDYFKIVQNKTLTRAQIQTAVNAWSDKYNVTSQVNEYNAKKQTEKTAFRANVTAAVQQLPAVISKLNAIDDNQSLTESQAADQTRQIIKNATQPLRELIFDVIPPQVAIVAISHGERMTKESMESSEEDFFGSK